MISAAQNAKEFANSLQTSFGNLGISLGTATGGWFISHYGIAVTPWVGNGFGILAMVMVFRRAWLDRVRRVDQSNSATNLRFSCGTQRNSRHKPSCGLSILNPSMRSSFRFGTKPEPFCAP
ncbi:hypothetical protein OQZ33_22835 [Pedobacter sp. MC2016-05]|uniref:hypothetical protein n=1 Tax=Pedobacter sp. MC2016-05 TaxID=2994474 RepID=UPI00224848B0|nr:hypothetical protein [Pedobacter sp. MC2016-05]MCX2477188.1 hypothetical protein [Pedobacter sp. MC2016-05]